MFDRLLPLLAHAQRYFTHGIRIAVFIVMVWIGGLKFFAYEADGIVPFVANSPLMSFFYTQPAPVYKQHMNKEGELVPANHQWHEANNTYGFANGLGVLIVFIGVLVLLGIWFPKAGLAGELLAVVMTAGTLSFLVTTPESWVPALGDTAHGFPFLSGRGRLVVKDVVILAGMLLCLSDTAQQLLAQRRR